MREVEAHSYARSPFGGRLYDTNREFALGEDP